MDKNLLINNLNKVHTTELGIIRIKKNLSLDVDDIVNWCINEIRRPLCIITRKGKNWYAKINGNIITINAHSYTIITAHKEKRGFKIDE